MAEDGAPAAAEPAGVVRGARQRKTVEQFTIQVAEKEEFRVVPGKGTRLGDIEAVNAGVTKHSSKEPLLQALYHAAFARRGAAAKVKAHLRDFSGFALGEDEREAELAKRSAFLKKRGLPEIKELCTLCTLERAGTKDELIERLLTFLDRPADTGRAPSAPRKRSATPAKKKKTKGKAAKTKPSASKRAASPKAAAAGEKGAKRAKTAAGGSKAGKGAKPASPAKKDPAASVPKPKPPLELYLDARLPALQEKNPEVGAAELKQHLRDKWKGLDEAKKAKYEAQAKEAKAQYDKAVEAARAAAAKPAIVDSDDDDDDDDDDDGDDDADGAGGDGDGDDNDEDEEEGSADD